VFIISYVINIYLVTVDTIHSACFSVLQMLWCPFIHSFVHSFIHSFIRMCCLQLRIYHGRHFSSGDCGFKIWVFRV